MKLRNKLILSCAALAAVATTAVSTTFAWYTANASVEATGVTGKTSQTDSTLLLISKSGKVGSWGASVAIDSSLVTLDPVAWDSTNSVYHAWDSDNNTEDTASVTGGLTASDSYISFYLYFKSGSNKSLDVTIDSFDLVNPLADADTLPTFSVLADGTGATDASYSVDMLRALNVVVTAASGTEVARTGTSPTTSTRGTAYNCNSLAANDNIAASTANAHTYYNNVKNTTIDDTKLYSESTTDIATLQSGTFTFATPTGEGAQAASGNLDNLLMVRFDIYLDGWNKYCFDAVRKQNFTLDMAFSASEHAGA